MKEYISMKKNVLLLLITVMTLTSSCTSFMGDDEDEGSAEAEVAEEVKNVQATGDDAALDNPTDAAASEEIAESAPAEGEAVAEEAPAAEEPAPAPAQEEQFADEQNIEEDLSQPNAPEETPQETAEVTPPAVEEAQTIVEEPAEPQASKVRITGIDYKANENGGTVVVSTNGVATYTTEENPQNNQYIIEIQNAILPKQFARPYNTKEFSGPIGMINAFKSPGSSNVRVVVQLKKPTSLSIVQEGNSLLVVPGGSVAEVEPEPVVEQAAAAEPGVTMTADEENQALQSKTLDEFLMGETKFYGKKISVEISDAEIKEVINFISEESGVNLVLSEEVKGKISVKLRQIPWDQALVVIMQTKQLGYIRQGNILRIAPLTSIRQETDSARQLMEAQKQIEPLRTKVFPISYAKSKELEPQIASFLSSRGTAKADERMNAVVVKDLAENIAKVEKLIERLDAQTPQVLIEGKVVETRQTFARTMGIQWTAEGSGLFSQNLVSNTLTKTASAVLNASLDISEDEGKVKILSSPRVVVLNNQTALIEQSNQFPIKSSTVGSGGATTETIEYKTVKLSLNVTPQIATDGGVILKTDILREFAGQIDPTIGADSGARPINSRSAKTTILVENGQTAVMGGIFQSDNTEGKSGIPLLKDIPILGYLFGKESVSNEKNELLIFLTPRILNRDRAFQISTGESSTDTL